MGVVTKLSAAAAGAAVCYTSADHCCEDVFPATSFGALNGASGLQMMYADGRAPSTPRGDARAGTGEAAATPRADHNKIVTVNNQIEAKRKELQTLRQDAMDQGQGGHNRGLHGYVQGLKADIEALQDKLDGILAQEGTPAQQDELCGRWSRNAAAAVARGNRDAAEVLMQKVAKLQPRNGQNWLDLGRLQFELQKFETAVHALQQAHGAGVKSFLSWYMLGFCLRKQAFENAATASEKYVEAATAFQNANQLWKEQEHEGPGHQRALFYLGSCLRHQKDYPAAETALNDAVNCKVENSSTVAKAQYLLGTVLSESKKHEDAAKAFKKAAELVGTGWEL